MDLYTCLAYRLPRIPENEEVLIRWEDLQQHLGNESANIGKFRQTVRRAWETVSGVYQQARHSVNLDQRIVRLGYAEPPTDNHMHKLGDGRIEIVSANKERSEEHTSELQSLMRNSYAVFCLKKKTKRNTNNNSTRSVKYKT